MPGINADSESLNTLFRAALHREFQRRTELYSPGVAQHLAEGILGEFTRMDALQRLKDSAGTPLQELPEMLHASAQPEGPERRLEVDRFIGDFTLFMVSFFPGALQAAKYSAEAPLVSRVGRVFVRFTRPSDYYLAEGSNAYGRAAETARLFDVEARDTFRRLSDRFDEYAVLMTDVKHVLHDCPQVRDLEDEFSE